MNATTRYPSFDALRAGALLLGIVLHATMSFLPGFHAVGWPIADVSQSTALSVVYFVIHVFRMTLFFLVAGFFARLLRERLGTWGFCRQRLRRIGLPLLAAMFIVMPLSLLPLVVAARLHAGGGGAAAMLRPQDGIPWGHLWFLYLLLVLYALGIALRAAWLTVDRPRVLARCADRAMRILVATRLMPLVLAAPLCLTLYWTSWWRPWNGVPTPAMGFIPGFPATLAFGSAMAVGWLLHRQQRLLGLLARDWPLYLCLAATTTTAACLLIGPAAPLTVLPLAPATRLAYAAAYTLAIWSGCLGLVGLAWALQRRESPGWRYLADASYWLYLTHIPLVWGLQVWMMDWPLHWSLKFPLILVLTLAVLLGLYRLAVRDTWVGRFLNGRQLFGPAVSGVASTH